MYKYIFLFLILFLFSCNETKRNNSFDIVEENKIDSIKITEVNIIEEVVDTITYDEIYFPIDSLLTTKLLTEGTFHEDEVDASVLNKEWFGLFTEGKKFNLSKTKLIVKRVNDPVLDENENEKTAWKINTVINDTSLVLIEVSPFLTERIIENYDLPQYIYPNDTISFNYLNKDYKLFATGGKRKESENSEWYIVWNYKLYLTSNINGIEQTELLVATSRFDDNMIRILFAGDIDGDEKLDLLIDTSNHYNATSPTLYLSKPAGEGHNIKPIATHTSVGC